MSRPLAQFQNNLSHAHHVLGLATAIDAQTSGAIDTDDLLRSALVSGVSALDHYVHEIVRKLMIEIADGKREPTEAYWRFSVSVRVMMYAANGVPASHCMDEAVRREHGHLAFQQPDKIADAIRLVWTGKLWPQVATSLGTDAMSLKRKIKLIVGRRNRIVHEADCDPSCPISRWPITATDAKRALSTIEETVLAIDKIL